MTILTEEKFIWPPRPMSGSMPIERIQLYEAYGWIYQVKFNDNRLCISKADGNVRFYTRHNKEFARSKYHFTASPLYDEIIQAFDKLDLSSGIQYLDGGLLHSKHAYFRDTLVIWDILVRNNQHLVGSTYRERYEWLLGKTEEPYYIEVGGERFHVGYKLTDNIFIPLSFDKPLVVWDLVQRINTAVGWNHQGEPLVEGVMCKDPEGVLKPGRREKNNTSWMARCRVKTGRHRH